MPRQRVSGTATWCRGARYWKGLVEGLLRVDLNGQPAGAVAKEQAQISKGRTSRRQCGRHRSKRQPLKRAMYTRPQGNRRARRRRRSRTYYLRCRGLKGAGWGKLFPIGPFPVCPLPLGLFAVPISASNPAPNGMAGPRAYESAGSGGEPTRTYSDPLIVTLMSCLMPTSLPSSAASCHAVS